MTDLSLPIYNNPDAAREHLESILWPNGPVCPHCGGIEKIKKLEGKSTRPGVYKCNDCRKPFSVTVGTVFERSKIPLHKWVLAAHLMAASKKGVSAHQLHRMMGMEYKTAWFMAMRLREAMDTKAAKGPLGSGGEAVEVDETFWGNRKGMANPLPKGGVTHKMKIVSLVERGGEKRSVVVADVTGKTLREVLRKQVSGNARLMTDERRSYIPAGEHCASHEAVSHRQGEYFRAPDITTNSVESSFALLKRGLIGTFHHVSEEHLQRYCHEFDFRWTHRKATDDTRAEALLKGVEGKRLMYRQPEAGEA